VAVASARLADSAKIVVNLHIQTNIKDGESWYEGRSGAKCGSWYGEERILEKRNLPGRRGKQKEEEGHGVTGRRQKGRWRKGESRHHLEKEGEKGNGSAKKRKKKRERGGEKREKKVKTEQEKKTTLIFVWHMSQSWLVNAEHNKGEHTVCGIYIKGSVRTRDLGQYKVTMKRT